ncbi:helix-turn-helix domain-containing protein [Thermovenabulum sp.]|uniref:helix-turn-helix domain-containing protein n=1 Tax=Thermovenabulum sp. TaxID=3100335 RepID=UPI003C7A3FFE
MEINEIKNFKDLGEYLKNEREKKGITLDYIEKETKIRKKYLSSMEEGNFQLIPGGDVYVKGFLKNYSQICGIDYISILNVYKNLVNNTEIKNKEENFIYKGENSKKEIQEVKINKKKIKAWVVWTFTLIIIAGIIYILNLNPLNYSFKSTNNENNLNNSESVIQSQIPNPNQNNTQNNQIPVQESKEEVKIVEETAKKITAEVLSEKIQANIKVLSDRCWISVKENGKIIFEGTLQPQEEKYFESTTGLEVRVGNPKAIEFFILNKKLPLSGSSPVTIFINKI